MSGAPLMVIGMSADPQSKGVAALVEWQRVWVVPLWDVT